MFNFEDAGTDWKATRDKLYAKVDEFNTWLKSKADEAKVYIDECNELTKLMLKQMWNDGGQYWNIIKEFFAWFGRLINWTEFRAVYVGVLLVIFGLILHYVFGV